MLRPPARPCACRAAVLPIPPPPSKSCSPGQVNATGAAERGAERNLNNNKGGKKTEKGKKTKPKQKKAPTTQPLHRGYPGDRANNWRGEQCILIKPLQETRGGNQVNCTEREQEIKNALRSEDGGSHPPLPSKTRPPGAAMLAGRPPQGWEAASASGALEGHHAAAPCWGLRHPWSMGMGVWDEPGHGSSSREVPEEWGASLVAAGAGPGDVSHHSPVPSPGPCCSMASAQAAPAALPVPQAKPSAFAFSCPGYFRFQTLPSRERHFPQLFPLLISHLLVKPLSPPPSRTHREAPIAACQPITAAQPGSPSSPREEKASQAPGCWKMGAGTEHEPQPSAPRLALVRGSAASPTGAPTTPGSRAGGINLCSQAICELSHSALHPAAC